MKQISFIGESWSHSFINLLVSSMYFFLAEPAGKRKRFLHQKTILSYILFIISNEIGLAECDRGYIVAWCSVIPSSLFVLFNVSFWMFFYSFSLHFVWCFFNPDVVLHVWLQVAHSFDSVRSLVSSLPLFDVCTDDWAGKLLFEISYVFGP